MARSILDLSLPTPRRLDPGVPLRYPPLPSGSIREAGLPRHRCPVRLEA